MAPLFPKVDLNKLWYDVQTEETLICAKFGKLFNISKGIGRKKVAQFFWLTVYIYWQRNIVKILQKVNCSFCRKLIKHAISPVNLCGCDEWVLESTLNIPLSRSYSCSLLTCPAACSYMSSTLHSSSLCYVTSTQLSSTWDASGLQ